MNYKITNSITYTSLDWLYKILHSKVDWCKFGNHIRRLQETNKFKLKQKLLTDSIYLAFRIIIIGDYGNIYTHFDTSIDGNYVYSINLSTIYLDIYNKLMSASKRDKNRYILFSYKSITNIDLGCSVNGIQ